jgi:ACS family glucarate transporter-like MFS transporter
MRRDPAIQHPGLAKGALVIKQIFLLVGLFFLSMLTYVDRVAISAAKEPIATDLALSDDQMGIVFGAFSLGYALMQVPTGALMDRFGPRVGLFSLVSLWSALTGVTGLIHGYFAMLATRFSFGMAEAGAFPGAARAIYNWLPASSRGIANGILFSGSRIGAAFAFPLITWMIAATNWRISFFILAASGLVWAVLWLAFFRDHPAGVSPQEEARSAPAKFSWAVFRSGRLALAMIQYFASNFTFFLCLSWMYVYLAQTYKLSPAEASRYAAAPLLFGAACQWITGWMVDALYKSRFRPWSRRLPALLGFAMSAAGMLLLVWADSPLYATACFTLATFGADMTVSPSWSFCADIGGIHAGSVSASMNMIGNFGSFVSASIFPVLLRLTGSGSAYFLVAAALNAVAIACWWFMHSTESPSQTKEA